MMEWRDEGLVLSLRPYGESAAIIEVFTKDHGRQAGLVRGGQSRRLAPVLQPGNQLAVEWRARLSEQLGHFRAEPLRSRARLMEGRATLAAMSAVTSLLQLMLAEQDPQPRLWQATVDCLDRIGLPGWQGDYLRWELVLLAETGFGLDLSACAVTGAQQGLAFVSPRSGRAVTWEGAGPWSDRLLPLPPGLAGAHALPMAGEDLRQGLALTGHFLSRAIEGMQATAARGGATLPEARLRLAGILPQSAG